MRGSSNKLPHSATSTLSANEIAAGKWFAHQEKMDRSVQNHREETLLVRDHESEASTQLHTSHFTMGSAYQILGRTVPAHQISIATLCATLLVAVPNPFSSSPAKTPKIEASSPEEEKFIQDYLKKAETAAAKEEKH